MNARVSITYYVEIVSSWGFWAEPAWAELKRRYRDRVEFDWKITLMDACGLPVSLDQLEWFYRRSGTIVRSDYMLNPGWYEPGLKEYLAPNLVAEAARTLGIDDDRVRLALATAAMREGRKVGRMEESIAVAAVASGLDAAKLRARAESPEVEARVRATTAEYHAFKMTQRPSFLIENTIGDRAVLSGVYTAEPLAAVMEGFLQDARDYAAYAAHYGTPPKS
jgi:predicted DsbA family dithiol-disulfide isomerase